jgi:Amidase
MRVGTDIGASIRIPAAYCSVCGHRPTTNRLPISGLKMSQWHIPTRYRWTNFSGVNGNELVRLRRPLAILVSS